LSFVELGDFRFLGVISAAENFCGFASTTPPSRLRRPKTVSAVFLGVWFDVAIVCAEARVRYGRVDWACGLSRSFNFHTLSPMRFRSCLDFATAE